MKHYVLVDPSLATFAERFVWLAVDTDRDENAPPAREVPGVVVADILHRRQR